MKFCLEVRLLFDFMGIRCILILQQMSSEISISISKILNWCLTSTNLKLEVGFYTLRSRSYLAHKSTMGYFNSQSLILNTSFRITYNTAQHIILCKISDLRDKSDVKVIGQIEIDLNLLSERKVLFIPFQDRDKVLEVRIYQQKNNNMESERNITDEQIQDRRQEFLQERFDFLDKLTQHQTQLKKNFSEKVYTLLKQLKNKNHETKNEKQIGKSHVQKEGKKNEIDFRNRLGQPKKKSDFHQAEPRNIKLSPAKHKYDHQLLIHSVHAKPQHKVDSPDQKYRDESPSGRGVRQGKQQIRTERYEVRLQGMGSGFNTNPAFGGIINQYLNQYSGR